MAGFTLVEYLEGTGTQWIDTEFLATGGMTAFYECMMMSNSPNLVGFVGSHDGNAFARLAAPRGYGNNWTYWRVDVVGDFAPINFGNWERFVYCAKNDVGYVIRDGKCVIHQTNPVSIVPASHATVCLWYHRKVENRIAIGKLKTVTIWDKDDVLVRNLIPALDPSGRPCMYDSVTHKPYYNQGTGEFSYGPVID